MEGTGCISLRGGAWQLFTRATLLVLLTLWVWPSPSSGFRTPPLARRPAAWKRHAAFNQGPGIPATTKSPLRLAASTQDAQLSAGTPLSEYSISEELVRPITTPAGVGPCVVTLLREQNFSSYTGVVPVTFTPPTRPECRGTWQLVVARMSTHVSGRQFDRRFVFSLDRIPLIVATTAEPRRPGVNFSVARDVTALSPFLRRRHPGIVNLGNVINENYTGIYYVTLKLLFYPGTPRAGLPNKILPAPNAAFIAPPNLVKAKLEIFVSHYQSDEFYWGNVPQSYYDSLSPDEQAAESNGSSFREVLALLDGIPVGAIFQQPLLYSGALDPGLWIPFLGIGSLLQPTYALDITPFVGSLLDGKPHSISLSVTNEADNALWITSGSLQLWTDPERKRTSGALMVNQFLSISIAESISAFGTLNSVTKISTRRQYQFTGFVVSSSGNVTTNITSSLQFDNSINSFRNGNSVEYDYNVSTMTTVKRSTADGQAISEQNEYSVFPLQLLFDVVVFPDTSYTQYVRVLHSAHKGMSLPYLNIFERLQNTQEVSSYGYSGNDTMYLASGMQVYNFTSSLNGCYLMEVESTVTLPLNVNVVLDSTNTTLC